MNQPERERAKCVICAQSHMARFLVTRAALGSFPFLSRVLPSRVIGAQTTLDQQLFNVEE